ncbi:DUF292-domain-containing protein [Anaeromyces robustus]|uniref:DUF292-domain-containing protein n=1 Tax=Anaeromyces robustus TaxID=1754192 RepID=A0A1Y1XI08_9FUNG|nr:DUF292-domain-containing protein [Anaeromyces robustus]|eukprot:ORX85389.1 DUF292-domain-containing protein [Anaeromyces robustus]
MKFSVDKLRVQLKLVTARIDLVYKKKISLNVKAKNEIANLLEKGKIKTARIKVENIIREDFNIESLEVLSLCCELLNTRLLLLNEKEVYDQALIEAIKNIIFSAPRCGVKELVNISKLLQAKFGKKFTKSALENTEQDINKTIYRNYTIKSIDENIVNKYLEEIASTYRIECEITQKTKDLNLSSNYNENDNSIIDDSKNNNSYVNTLNASNSINKQQSMDYNNTMNYAHNLNMNVNNNMNINMNNDMRLNNNMNMNNPIYINNNNRNMNINNSSNLNTTYKSDSFNINKNIERNIEMNKVDINDSNDVKKIINDKNIYSRWKKFKGIESDSNDEINSNKRKTVKKTYY